MDEDFIDITKLDVQQGNLFLPGSLVLQASGGEPQARLTIKAGDQDPEAASNFYLDFSTGRVLRNNARWERWIAVRNWRLVVNVSSSMSPNGGMPAPGDAGMCDGHPGFYVRMDHGEVFVTLTGALIQGIEWATYSGFRSWRIVTDDCEGDNAIILVERSAPAE